MTTASKLEAIANLAQVLSRGPSHWLADTVHGPRPNGPSDALARAFDATVELSTLPQRSPPSGPSGQWVRTDLDAIAATGGDCVEKSLALLALCHALALDARPAWQAQRGTRDHLVVAVRERDGTERILDPSDGSIL